MLLFASGFWVSSAMFMSRGPVYPQWVSSLFGATVLAGCSLLLAAAWKRGFAVPLMGLFGILLGLAVSSFAATGYLADSNAAAQEGYRGWDVQVIEDSKEGEFGASCMVRCKLSNGRKVRVRLNLPQGATADCWQLAHIKGELKLPSKASAFRYWSKGCVGSLSPESVRFHPPSGALGAVSRLRECGIGVFDTEDSNSDSRILMKAVLFGDRRDLFRSDLYSVVKTIGLAHIVAVSGAHLVMITGFFLLMLRAAGVSKRVCVPVQLAVVIGYACLTGIPVSVLRAAVMTSCALAAFYAKRASSSLNALSLCVVGMMVADPFLSLSVSLALSACASLGIMLLSQKLSRTVSDLFHDRFRVVSDSLSVCLSANVFTLPISISVFGQFPLIAPVSNLLAVPVFPFLVCYGMVATLLAALLPAAAGWVVFPVLVVGDMFCRAARFLAEIPFACVVADGSLTGLSFVAIAATGAFLFFHGRVGSAWIASIAVAAVSLLCAWLMLKPYVSGHRIVALDVGQGDAILLASRDRAVLVDTGTNDAALLSGLARHGVRRLDAVVVTHPDDDHCGSLGALLDVMPVEKVFVAQGVLQSEEDRCVKLDGVLQGQPSAALIAGDSFSSGCFCFHIVSPLRPSAEGANEDSLVVIVQADVNGDGKGDWKALLTGDAEAEVLRPLAVRGSLEDVDILKVPHHGSKAAVSEDLLCVLQPEIALVSVGEHNRYGHPSLETLGLLEGCGANVFRTDAMGDVVCKLHSDGITVKGVG